MRIGEREPPDGFPVWLSVDGVLRAEARIPDDLDAYRLSGINVDEIRAFVLAPRQRARRAERIGEYLHALLARGEVADRWAELSRDGLPTRFLLHVKGDLVALPWELMVRDGLPLFAEEARPWSRLLDAEAVDRTLDPMEEKRRHCPLRLLVVVGTKERHPGDAADRQDLHAEEEVQAIISAQRESELRIERQILWRPTREELDQALVWTEPHILHFIAHSTAADDDDEEPETDALLIESPRAPWEYGPRDISIHLARCVPRLVVLNACRSAGDGASAANSEVVWRVGRRYAERADGPVPAVLAMQGDVSGAAAADFAGRFYHALFVDRKPVDRAVATARAGMKREFALPCLMLNHHPEQVLPVELPPASVLRDLKRIYGAEPFVDRHEERWKLMSRERPSSLVQVTGASDSGKSYAVRWTLWMEALRGRNVAYVSLRDKEDDPRRGPFDVLGLVRLELERSPVHGVANQQAFAGLDLGREFAEAPRDAHVERPFAVFGQRLARAADPSGLLIALDHLDSADDQFDRTVGEQLLKRVADGELAGVTMIVIRSALGDPWRSGENLGRVVEIGPIAAPRYKPLALELMYWHRMPADEARGWADGMSPSVQGDWTLGRFKALNEILSQTMKGRT